MNLAPEGDAARYNDQSPGWEAETAVMEFDPSLPAGTRLRDYEVQSVARASDFDIVYVAWDHSLRRRVALQEYLPRLLTVRVVGSALLELRSGASAETFAVGLRAFVAEARMLARFDHAALVKVYRFWEENGTAYRVLSLSEGPTLEAVFAERTQSEAEVRAWLRPVLDAVSVMHAARCYHHHIGADNIVLTNTGPVLQDFAAPRRLVESLSGRFGTAAKPGYAALELYSEAATLAPGPWTDLYALAALAYRAVTGSVPAAAPERLAHDRVKPLAELTPTPVSEGFAVAIDAALALQPEDRTETDAAFREHLGSMEAPLPPIPISRTRDLMSEPFAKDESSAREITVPIATQPYPAPMIDAAHPMDEPFVPAPETPAPAPAAEPFTRADIGLSRNVKIAIGAGVLVLGGVAAAVLSTYAGRPSGSSESEKASAPSAPAPPSASLRVAPPLSPARQAPAPAASAPQPLPEPAAVAPAARLPPLPDEAAAPRRETAAPLTEAERRIRCSDLLQEATLRRLTTPEAAFFKKECR